MQRDLPPLSLYIHFPWCEKKCPYCDFNSHETTVIPEADYIDAVLRDLQLEAGELAGRSIETLFIGGGTPSLMSAAGMQRLMQGIGTLVDLTPTLEATMEANPGSSEADKFAGFREAGINRLSLGIQSFQDSQLESLGRIHTSDQAHAAIEQLKSVGFNNFNLDLMHGLPRQSSSDARKDLQTALRYQPSHLSWYQLTIEPNTVFHNRPPLLPVENTLATIQSQGEQLLADARLVQYEVSAYSRQGKESRHNLNYWNFGDYLGIGAGAHGKVTQADGRIIRYSKRRQPKDYLGCDEQSYRAQQHVIATEELTGEFLLNALRLNQGFLLSDFSARTGLPTATLQPKLQSMIEKGLLLHNDGRIATTQLGRRFLDSVVAEFFPD